MTFDEKLNGMYWLLRVAVCAEFIGHGAFGILTKSAWVPYFGLFGIPEAWAWRLMPVVGAMDIMLGLIALLSPRRGFLAWMALWGLFTALLRPLVGEPFWEAIERAGNVGAPLALLLLCGASGRGWRCWFGETARPDGEGFRPATLLSTLRWTTGLLLIGHGALACLTGKPLLAAHLTAVGLDGTALLPAHGALEIALGTTALTVPLTANWGPYFLGRAVWKVATELLFPLSGAPIWEFVERGGSYAAPLCVAWLLLARVPATGGVSLSLGRPAGGDTNCPIA